MGVFVGVHGRKIVAAAMALLCSGAASTVIAQTLSHYPDQGLRDGFDGVAAGPYSDSDAARFLAQATFGPTTADIAHLRTVGYQGWLTEQFAKPASTQVPFLNYVGNLPAPDNDVDDNTRMEAWWINSLGTADPSRGNVAVTDQLRERVAFALSEIFVVSNINGTLSNQPWALAGYYDMLVNDAFGNYRTLLEDVTKHPAMGIYLNMLANQKANPAENIHPDENYAREIMQLFSVGLNKLNVDGTLTGGVAQPAYNQSVVRGMAAVFTGWDWNQVGCGATTYDCCDEDNFSYCGPSNQDDLPWQYPMQSIEAYHDTTTDKQLLVYNGVALANGILPHGGNAQAELTAALNNIFNHPNVGPFIATRLIQRLVTSNPSPEYVGRVAAIFNSNGAGVRGDLKAVIQAILLDIEARSGQWKTPTTYGKLREPMLKLTHMWRAMAASSLGGRVDSPYPPWEETYGQAALRSPTVFNFFKFDFQQPGELSVQHLFSPEFQILTDTTAVTSPNDIGYRILCDYIGSSACGSSSEPATISMDETRDAALALSNPTQLVENYSVLFMSRQMSPFMRQALITRLSALTNNTNGDLGRRRIQHALYLIMNSPEYSVQK